MRQLRNQRAQYPSHVVRSLPTCDRHDQDSCRLSLCRDKDDSVGQILQFDVLANRVLARKRGIRIGGQSSRLRKEERLHQRDGRNGEDDAQTEAKGNENHGNLLEVDVCVCVCGAKKAHSSLTPLAIRAIATGHTNREVGVSGSRPTAGRSPWIGRLRTVQGRGENHQQLCIPGTRQRLLEK